MKKFYFSFLASIMFVQFSYAQWVTSGNDIITTNTGNIGIGTTNPNGVYSSSNKIVHLLGSTNGAEFIVERSGGISKSYLVQTANDETRIGNSGSRSLLFETNMAERMRIDALGNVGIGTASPQTMLHIYGSTAVRAETSGGNSKTGFEMASAYYGGVGSGLYFFPGGSSIGNNAFAENVNGAIETNMVALAGGNIKLGTAGGQSTQLYTNSLARLSILANGNVGIGTTTPDSKLAVNGTIHSKQVTIDLNGWADYVFNKDYALPSLSDVKTYIDQNHHLPEVPSEKEITEKGLNLGEMNKLLMKKIEELTLYLIEKDKQIETQNGLLKTQQSLLLKIQQDQQNLDKKVENILNKK